MTQIVVDADVASFLFKNLPIGRRYDSLSSCSGHRKALELYHQIDSLAVAKEPRGAGCLGGLSM